MPYKSLQRCFTASTCLALSVASFGTDAARAEEGAGARESLSAFIDEMASTHGFDRDELERAFRETKLHSGILELMDRQSEPRPWDEYRARFVNEEKLDAGRRFWNENEPYLRAAREKYGVPEEIVTAVIGIETNYGRHKGRYGVLEALSTLAFGYPRRARTFRTELEHFLLLSREEALPLDAPVGSYAGAMGIAQFMPGSYRRYAIDFDGDGKRDLFDSRADAIGSVANYLTAHGWKRDQPVAARPDVPSGNLAPFLGANLTTRYDLEELRRAGVTLNGTYPSTQRAIPLTLRNEGTREYWLGFENFYVITRYNHSVYYAMAVHQLARGLRERYDGASGRGDR